MTETPPPLAFQVMEGVGKAEVVWVTRTTPLLTFQVTEVVVTGRGCVVGERTPFPLAFRVMKRVGEAEFVWWWLCHCLWAPAAAGVITGVVSAAAQCRWRCAVVTMCRDVVVMIFNMSTVG